MSVPVRPRTLLPVLVACTLAVLGLGSPATASGEDLAFTYVGPLAVGTTLHAAVGGAHNFWFTFYTAPGCNRADQVWGAADPAVVPVTALGGSVHVEYDVPHEDPDLGTIDDHYVGDCAGPIVAGASDAAFDSRIVASIDGTPQVGQELTARYAGVSPQPDEVTYSWRVGDGEVSTDPTFTPRPGDEHESLTLTVTATKSGYVDSVSTTTPVVIAAAALAGFAAKPQVTIDGTPAVGQELTAAVTGGDPDATTTTKTYQWFVGGAPYGTPTSDATFTVPEAAAGGPVGVRVTSSAEGFEDDESTAEPVSIPWQTFEIDPPTLGDVQQVGVPLTCSPPDVRGEVHYAWMSGDDTLSTDESYTPVADDAGAVLTCRVTVSRAGYEDATSSADTEEIGAGTFTIGAPVISGTPEVGRELTCAPPDGLEETPEYAWSSGGAPLGSTATYTPEPSDVGAVLTCTITVSRPGHEDASSEATTDEIALGQQAVDDPTVEGTPQVGQELTCVPPDGLVGTPSYTWWSGTLPLVADSATYTPGPSDVGQPLECDMTVTRDGYERSVRWATTDRVARGTFEILDPTLSGSPMVGGLLTCTPPSGEFETSLVWRRGDDVVDEGSQHQVDITDLGEVLTCEVTASQDGYDDATSHADTVTVGEGQLSIAAPTIAGAAQVGQTVTCSDDEVDAAFTWDSGDVTVGHSPSYDVQPSDVGHVLTCRVTVTRSGYQPAVATAQAGPVVPGVLALAAPTIQGTPVYGGTLTCFAPAGVTDGVFSWLRGEVVVATGATYTIAPEDVGQVLTCRVDVVRTGFASASASVATNPVSAAPARPFTVGLDGTPRVGGTLRGSVPGLPAGAVVSWQWLRDGDAVRGATSARYDLVPGDHGHRFRVRATVAEPGHEAGSASSPPSDVVELRKLRLSVAPVRFHAGDLVQVTISNLVPGEAWTLSLGNGEWSTGGTAPAAGETLTRTVRIPRELSRYGERHLVVRTRNPVRAGWAPVTIDG